MNTFTKIATSKPVGKILNNKFVKKVMRPVGDKVIDKTSTFIANNFMGVNKAKKSIADSKQLVSDLKLVKKTKGYDTSDKDWRDPVFRARVNVAANLPSNIKFKK